MRNFASVVLTSSAALLCLAPITAAHEFNNVLGVEKELHIVDRVADRSIFTDIRRVQSHDVSKTTSSGTVTVRETNEAAVLANNDVVIGLCQSVQMIKKLSTEMCGVRSAGKTRGTSTAHIPN